MKKGTMILGVALLVCSNLTPIVAEATTVLNEETVEQSAKATTSTSAINEGESKATENPSLTSESIEEEEPISPSKNNDIPDQKEESVESDKRVKDDLATGTLGTSAWHIDHTGILYIGPGDLTANGTSWTSSPWYNYKSDIIKIVFEGPVTSSKLDHLFQQLSMVTQIDGIGQLDTSKATTMKAMFSGTNIQNLDLSSFDTSNVTDMSTMFYISNIENVNFSGWDTSNVTNMSNMFNGGGSQGMSSLKNLDLSSFDTSNVTSMNSMFWHCKNLQNLNISNFNTSSVTDMTGMLQDTGNLQKIVLGSEFSFKGAVGLSTPVAVNGTGTGNWIKEDYSSKGYSPKEFMSSYGTGDLTAGAYVAETEHHVTVTVPKAIVEQPYAGDLVLRGKVSSYGTAETGEKIPIDYQKTNTVWILVNGAQYKTNCTVDSNFNFELMLPVGTSLKQNDELTNIVIPGTVENGALFDQVIFEFTSITVLANQASIDAKDSTIYTGDTWSAKDNFISATDKEGNTVGFSNIKVSGTVDTTAAGSYDVTYDNNGVSKQVTITVKENKEQIKVHDATVYVGDTFGDMTWLLDGVTDKDGNNVDSSNAQVDGNSSIITEQFLDGFVLKMVKEGVFEAKYTYGGASATAKITVKADQTAVEAKDSTLYIGDSWTASDNFVSATDKEGKAIDFKNIKVTGNVDSTKAELYDITYDNNGKKKTITVTVLADQTSIEAKDSTLYVGDFWQAQHNFISATDKDGNLITINEIKVTGSVDTSKAGIYKITYENAGVTKTISVTVVDLAEIEVHDSDLYVGEAWSESDNFDKAIDAHGDKVDIKSLMIDGNVDTQSAGIYKVKYSMVPVMIPPRFIQDTGTYTATATITVHENKTSIEAKNSTLYVGDSWNSKDNFLSATDKEGKAVAFKEITTSGSVDTTKAGLYDITYTNDGVSKTITVTVIALNNSVTIHYQDEKGNEISPDKILNGKIGDSYTSEEIKIEGYTVKAVHGDTSGKFTDKAQTVTYIYTKNPVKGAKVIVHYQDEKGTELASDKILNGTVGDSYTSEQLKIEGYTFKEVQGDTTGKFTDRNQIVTYVYIKDSDEAAVNPDPKPTPHPNPNTDTSTSTSETNSGKEKLPQTGESQNSSFVIFGGLMLLCGFILGRKKFKRSN